MEKKTKAFGLNRQTQKETSSDLQTNPSLHKWSEGIAQQKETKAPTLNAKYIPLNQVQLDTENARCSHLSLNDLINGPKITKFPFDEIAQKEFEENVQSFFQDRSHTKDTKKAIKEYLSLGTLAASIEKPEKLIHPISVYLKDMLFLVNSGHRRVMAHYLLNADKIAAVIKEPSDTTLEKNISQFKENEEREDLSLVEKISAVSKIIKAYEKTFGEISINKLAGLLGIKRTKAANLLSVYKEFNKNPIFKKSIETEALTSIEAANHIAQMESTEEKNAVLQTLLAGESLTYKQLIARTKNPKIAVRSPDTHILNFKSCLKINKGTNIKPISKLLLLALNNPELKKHQTDILALNLESKTGLLQAWEKLLTILG